MSQTNQPDRLKMLDVMENKITDMIIMFEQDTGLKITGINVYDHRKGCFDTINTEKAIIVNIKFLRE